MSVRVMVRELTKRALLCAIRCLLFLNETSVELKCQGPQSRLAPRVLDIATARPSQQLVRGVSGILRDFCGCFSARTPNGDALLPCSALAFLCQFVLRPRSLATGTSRRISLGRPM